MEHELSAFYDITHGEGLAILTPHWMDFALNDDTASKFADYARNVWDVVNDDDMAAAKEGIACTREFFKKMGLPQTLSDVGIDKEHFDIMAQKAADGCVGSFVPLLKQLYKNKNKQDQIGLRSCLFLLCRDIEIILL